MPFPSTLYNSFNQGKDNLELSSNLLNPYAKWMQSPNIPRNVHLPIAFENIENTKESDPTVLEWFDQLESNTRRMTTEVPLFFPLDYHDRNHFCTIFKGDNRWLYSLLSASDNMFNYYSEKQKDNEVEKLILNASVSFPKLYNSAIFRLYKKKKNEIYSSLFRKQDSSSLHVYSLVLKKRILIIRKHGYEWTCGYSKYDETICLWENDNNEVGALIRENNQCIDIEPILKNCLDLCKERTEKMKIVCNSKSLEKNRELNKKTMPELKLEASEKGLISNNLKKKDLVDALLESFTKISDCM
tara:strand:- start:1739 stop:2638 length:900 start_codon:yes stop_codon:yes gene_type:complete